MPLFEWLVQNNQNNLQKGKAIARSLQHMEQLLRQKGAHTIIYCIEKYVQFSWSYKESATFFYELGTLIEAGIPMADALDSIDEIIKDNRIKSIMKDCSEGFKEGIALSQLFSFYTELFDPFVVVLLKTGEETGTFASVCLALARYYENLFEFQKKITAALFMPCITFVIFLFVLLLFFFIIIPKFGLLLSSFNKELPWRTALLLNIAKFLNCYWPQILCVIVVFFIMGYYLIMKQSQKRVSLITILERIPFLGYWIDFHVTARFLRLLSMLLGGGIDMRRSLQLIFPLFSSYRLEKKYEKCAQLVEAGHPLSESLQLSHIVLTRVCSSFIVIGESTGTLAHMIKKCATYYEEKFFHMLDTVSKIIQPLLVIFLGLLVAVLVIIIYEPLLTLSTLVIN